MKPVPTSWPACPSVLIGLKRRCRGFALMFKPESSFRLTPMPFPEALQEFKVETSALPAQYGHHSGGSVNAVTKAGTNAFHGTAFEYVRNGVFNARNAFALTRDGLKRNQFGGTFGGPVPKN